MKINDKDVSELIFATIPDPVERAHIFECLWASDRIHEASFRITIEGHIKPNIESFEQHGNHRAEVYYALIGYFTGWLDGWERAEEISH